MARRIAILFPGQASQQVGMGRVACARYPAARDVFDRIDSALDMAVSRACFDGPADLLQETRWQQPAVFACSMALHAAWLASNPDVAVAGGAGHSLGEYGALVAAEALALEDAARLVALRGRLMQEAADMARGGMSAVIGLAEPLLSRYAPKFRGPRPGRWRRWCWPTTTVRTSRSYPAGCPRSSERRWR